MPCHALFTVCLPTYAKAAYCEGIYRNANFSQHTYMRLNDSPKGMYLGKVNTPRTTQECRSKRVHKGMKKKHLKWDKYSYYTLAEQKFPADLIKFRQLAYLLKVNRSNQGYKVSNP